MKFSTVAVASLFCTLSAAGPIFRARPQRLSFRQAGPFLNTTTDALPSIEPNTEIELLPIDLSPETMTDLTSTERLPSSEPTTSTADSTFATTTVDTTSLSTTESEQQSTEDAFPTDSLTTSTPEFTETTSSESLAETISPSETSIPPPNGEFVISFGSKAVEFTAPSQSSFEITPTIIPAANSTASTEPAFTTTSSSIFLEATSSEIISDEITITEDFTSIITSTASDFPTSSNAPIENVTGPDEQPVLDDGASTGNVTLPSNDTLVEETGNIATTTFKEATVFPTLTPTNSTSTAPDNELNPPFTVTDESILPGGEATSGPQFTFTTISESSIPEELLRSEPVTSTVTSPSSTQIITSTASSIASFDPPAQETSVEVPTQVLASVPTIISELPVATSITEDQYEANLKQAQVYMDVFASLDETSPCTAGTVACINRATATCSGNTFILSECGAGEACYALPMEEVAGVYVGCYDIAEAKAILAGAPFEPADPIADQPIESAPLPAPEEEETTTLEVTTLETIFVTATPSPVITPSPEPEREESVIAPTPSPRVGGPDRVVEPVAISTVTPIAEPVSETTIILAPTEPAAGPIDLQPLSFDTEDRVQPEEIVELAAEPTPTPIPSPQPAPSPERPVPTPSPILLVEQPVVPTPSPQSGTKSQGGEQAGEDEEVTVVVTTTERWERVVEITKTETETVTAYMSADSVGQWQRVE